jgi:hypothetical protein
MRRGLLLAVLVIAVLAAFTPAAGAAEGDPVVYFSFDDGAYYPQNYDVTFGFMCVSPTSAIVSCEASQPMGSKLDTFHAGTHTVTVTAVDYEGRQTFATQTYTVIDTTKPHVVYRTPADGATYEVGAQLTYDYSCEDDPGGLGIYECFSSQPVGMPIDTQQPGTFTFEVVAVDNEFNISQQTITYTVADHTPPRITLSSPSDGATYKVGDYVQAWFACDDGPFGSGMNGCKGDLPAGSQLDTSSVGARTFTVTAYDRAGNVSRLSNAYSVIYDFTGFAPPAADYPSATSMRAGEAVPLKFSLNGNRGLDIFAFNSPTWLPCGALDGTTPADGTLSYNASADRYTYLASTSKSWAGSCRDLIVTLRDETVHRARFIFTK